MRLDDLAQTYRLSMTARANLTSRHMKTIPAVFTSPFWQHACFSELSTASNCNLRAKMGFGIMSAKPVHITGGSTVLSDVTCSLSAKPIILPALSVRT